MRTHSPNFSDKLEQSPVQALTTKCLNDEEDKFGRGIQPEETMIEHESEPADSYKAESA